jgi:predicted transcriptional regulator
MTRSFGELEASILHTIRILQKASVHEIRRQLGNQDRYTTLLTVVSRLYQKGELTREKVGHHFEYALAPKKSLSSHSFLKRLKAKFFGGSVSEMVCHLLDSEEELSDEEIELIEKALEEAKKRR